MSHCRMMMWKRLAAVHPGSGLHPVSVLPSTTTGLERPTVRSSMQHYGLLIFDLEKPFGRYSRGIWRFIHCLSFFHERLNWSFRRQTSDATKLPSNWADLGTNLTLRMSFLVMAYNIHVELVINADQTGLQLMPVGNEKTYVMRGANSVLVSGGGDKRQISLLLLTTPTEKFLPGQAIFEGKTTKSIPDGEYPPLLRHLGWQLTHTQNHWSLVETMKEYIVRIFLAWFSAVCIEKDLNPSLDCFSVHRFDDF